MIQRNMKSDDTNKHGQQIRSKRESKREMERQQQLEQEKHEKIIVSSRVSN